MRKPIVLAVLILFATTAQAARRTASPASHLRCLSEMAARLASDANSRSPLIRSFLHQIERSDVIVLLNVSPTRPDDRLKGEMRFVTAAPGARYLFIEIDGSRPLASERIALLGHELCHVLEVVRAPEVTDGTSFRRLYRRIGIEWLQGHFETTDARAAEAAVRDEACDVAREPGRVPAALVHLLGADSAPDPADDSTV